MSDNTPLSSQKELFNLEEEHTWLNCAYWSPMLKTVEAIGHTEVSRKNRPYNYEIKDFFDPIEKLKQNFARLVNVSDAERIAVVSSTSYALANVAANISMTSQENVVVVEATFPSLYYTFEQLCTQASAELRMVKMPETFPLGDDWNEAILNAIDDQTKAVAIGNVHWTDGTLFKLDEISAKAKKHGALLVIDGTQSVGALPFDVEKIQPDALICAGYKWLFGPYGLGMAYYGPAFDSGNPIEQNWMARRNSDDFKNLVNYESEYRDKAFRYSMGESSQFILAPMLARSLEQIIEWNPARINQYCDKITKKALAELLEMGCLLESPENRSPHLFGVRFTDNIDAAKLQEQFTKEKIYVSLRGSAIRIAPHVYNTEDDLALLVDCFRKSRN